MTLPHPNKRRDLDAILADIDRALAALRAARAECDAGLAWNRDARAKLERYAARPDHDRNEG